MKTALTYDDVRWLFDYKDGRLIRRVRTARCVRVGEEPGWVCKKIGYRRIEVGRKTYLTHRLVWLWHYGYYPENDLDHINRDKLDNRIENLREASRSCNVENRWNPKNNTSGVKGVHLCKPRSLWQARINCKGKRKSLGYYKDRHEAILARLAAEQCLERVSCHSVSPAYKYAVKHKLISTS